MSEAMYFDVGEIVTLKTHPLFKKHSIDIFSNQVPPLMLIKEVYFEDKKKKLYSEEVEAVQISDKVKYTCVYFNNNKSEFVEVTLYHSFLESYSNLKFDREVDKEGKETKSAVSLIDEVKLYQQATYKFGESVNFKTFKLEKRKKFKGVKDNSTKVSFTSPAFILSGFKQEALTDLFYGDGKVKRKVSKVLYKVMWFNHFQQKFSEQYLPAEFFIKNIEIQPFGEELHSVIQETLN